MTTFEEINVEDVAGRIVVEVCRQADSLLSLAASRGDRYLQRMGQRILDAVDPERHELYPGDVTT